MPTREEMIKALEESDKATKKPTREEMIAALESSESDKQYSPSETAYANFENSGTFGARAGLEGLGSGIGTAIGMYPYLPDNMSTMDKLSETWKDAKEEAGKTREQSKQELAKMSEQNPKSAMAGKGLGIVATAPLGGFGAKGLLTMGAVGGAGEAASNANSLGEAVQDIGAGALTNLVVGKGLSRLGAGAKGFTKGVQEGAQAIEGGLAGKTGEVLGSAARSLKIPQAVGAVGSGVKMVGETVGNAATRVASGLTGVSEDEIKAFATQTDKIQQLAKTFKNDTQGMVDNFRQKLSANIKLAKNKVGESIGESLSSSDKVISIAPAVKELEAAQKALHPKFNADEIEEIGELINLAKSAGDNLPASEFNLLKQKLQDLGRSGYTKNGKIFSPGDKVTGAAIKAARAGRLALDEAVPAVRAANKQLEALHIIEDKMNPNLLKQGAPPSSVLGAGAGTDLRSRASLKALGKATGTPALEEATQAAAANTFGNAQLLPTYSTGKTMASMAAGAGIGYAADGKEGALAGAALTSPLALKYAILAGKVPVSVLSKVPGFTGKVTDDVVSKAFKLLGGVVSTRTGQEAVRTLQKYNDIKANKGKEPIVSQQQAADMFQKDHN